ncbi:MAG TPA: hypothetical protein VGJ68_00470 [Bradyrhizobium sp.]
MFQQSYSVGGQSEIHLHFEHGGGDVHLLGTDETYLRIQGEGDAGEYKADWQNGTLTMNVHADAVFFVPRNMNLRVSGNFGDFNATDLLGSLRVAGAHGDVGLNAIGGAVTLESVMGDLRAAELGSLSVNEAMHGDAVIDRIGDVALHDVQGDLHVDDCGALRVEGDVSGSAKISAVHGDVMLGEVRGDLVARDTGSFAAANVRGDVRIADVEGDLRLGDVNGDAKIQAVEGNLAVTSVSGDARIVEIGGGVPSLTAGGDLVVQTELRAQDRYEFSSGGDLVLVLAGDHPAAKLECHAGGDIQHRFGKGVSAEQHWIGEIGEGGPSVRLHAGGDILIKPESGDNMEFRVEINKEELKRAQQDIKRARAEMKRIKQEIKARMRDQKHEIKHQVHEDLERQFGHFRFSRPPRPPRPPRGPGFNWSGFSSNWPFGPSGGEPAPRRAEVSDEERMTILKMLEEKKITPEQAEMLLKALGEE